MEPGAIVLEGGALRGVYTSGVLDVLMEHDLYFSAVYGVSAGALNGLSYVSRQIGRSAQINLSYVRDPRYLGIGQLIKNHSAFNFDFMFGELSERLVPFDYGIFFASAQKYIAVATSCRTGQAAYFQKTQLGDEIFRAAVASSSLPFLAKPMDVGGEFYYDGGISDAVPAEKALQDGHEKVIAVLTHPRGQRKALPLPLPPEHSLALVYRRAFSQWPALQKALLQMDDRYNKQMDRLDRLEDAGKVFVIRPQKAVNVSAVEKNTEKLKALYQEGRRDMENALPRLKNYLAAETGKFAGRR